MINHIQKTIGVVLQNPFIKEMCFICLYVDPPNATQDNYLFFVFLYECD